MSTIKELMELQESVTPKVLEKLAENDVLILEEQQSMQQRCLEKIAKLQGQNKKTADCLQTKLDSDSIRMGTAHEEQGFLQPIPFRKKTVTKSYYSIKMKKWFIIAAVCALVFSLSTTAIGTLTTDTRLLQLFQADSQSQIGQLNEMSYQINQTVTVNGYTLTLQEAINDRYHTWLLLELKGPDDSKLNGDQIYFKQTSVQLEKMGGFGYTMFSLPDDNPDDNCVSLVLDLSTQKKIPTQEITVSFEDLGWYNYANGQESNLDSEWVMEAEGIWQFTFQLPQNASTVSMWQWKVLQNNEKPFFLHKIEVSPLSITLEANRLCWDKYVNLPKAPVQVFLKDGSKLELSCSSSSGSGCMMQFSYNFTSPINLKSIDRIIYCGRELNW